jgi:hypothetical protein
MRVCSAAMLCSAVCARSDNGAARDNISSHNNIFVPVLFFICLPSLLDSDNPGNNSENSRQRYTDI